MVVASEPESYLPSPAASHTTAANDSSSSSTTAAGLPPQRTSPHPYHPHLRHVSLRRSTRTRSSSLGYRTAVFTTKPTQLERVILLLHNNPFIPPNSIREEVEWFYESLGIDDTYFALQDEEIIARHVLALWSAKIGAYVNSERELDVHLKQEDEDGAVFIHSTVPGHQVPPSPTATVTSFSTAGPSAVGAGGAASRSDTPHGHYERTIEDKYLDSPPADHIYRLESYRSQAHIEHPLRSYFVTRCHFPTPSSDASSSTDAFNIRAVSDIGFLEKVSESALARYSRIVRQVVERKGIVVEQHLGSGGSGGGEVRLYLGFQRLSAKGFFTTLTDLYHYYGLTSTRKYVEQFSNGATVVCVHLTNFPQSEDKAEREGKVQWILTQLTRDASLLYCLPSTPLQHLFSGQLLSVQESVYAYTGWIFAQHFLNRLGTEYATLQRLLTKGGEEDGAVAGVLAKLKKRLREVTYTRQEVLDVITAYPELIRSCYKMFERVHGVNASNRRAPSPSPYANEEYDAAGIMEKIESVVANEHEVAVFQAFVTFNQAVLKTNFYQPTKVALSFRLDSAWLPEIEYPMPLYGMFLIIGSEFRGFHLRFRDVARGGIRIVQSRNRESYSINLRSLFDENYALASTQQKKNKDIPEGGSKGTILLDYGVGAIPRVAFEKYVDAMLDLLIPGQTPGIKEPIVDLLGKEEILFFGPDEGTAEFMDWASLHARHRGAGFWKAFTTGKGAGMGGIPHDTYGMTTRSIHQYVLGIYRKLGLEEGMVRKIQTGGPDGDLGSNEVKISGDRTVAIADGNGVLYDPQGIDRGELMRLAGERKACGAFDVKKLGKGGFRVLVDETKVTLPDGSVVENGFKFRNEFHLDKLAQAELFVPCGGRPESVNLTNVHRLLDEDGVPRWKYVVEGANLFFTQEARLFLEKKGVVIFKDASANKGGVTSSSLEVLAALALNDDEFAQHMQVKGDVVPPFYEKYVEEVQTIIERNARAEFECIWREHDRLKIPRSILTDQISIAIVKLNEEIQQNPVLWDDIPLRRLVLSEALPKLLLEQLGLDTILKRVPDNYVRAIFGSWLASRFVYEFGHESGQFAFLQFMLGYFGKLGQE
ncbi:hypothetical protein G7K_5865-t1 [Saitoella complicata NRRL Y-17804]|uniref:NAD-specific glutamate dehydrogenase n=2 Tax=Saitoella complicata (strain BCRC 22490 / CBS 7301 / JCM 7358 / NBRC 10748 / NRRL Y-17804) TaxID=698492 RepID=A0A0E9NPG6_SAICN|nr:hypothetical protein G7K_5865-t1 [Saitoella complicata NRRL Y-17804]